MDQEMIERVSKAILETPNASDYKTLVAKNAIKAMREPTEKMLGAGMDGDSLEMGSSAYGCWQDMIDAIIGE